MDSPVRVMPTADRRRTVPAMIASGASDPVPPRRVRLPIAVGAIGTALFTSLALVLAWWDGENEQRLLDEQTAQAGVVLTVSINEFLQPLTSIARTADVTDGDVDVFSDLADQMMSGDGALPYSSIALVDASGDAVLSTRGEPLVIAATGEPSITAPSDGTVGIHDLLDDRTLGFATLSPSGRFVIYAERQLSSDPSVRQRSDGPFGSLDYAIYLGDAARDDTLLSASTPDLPLAEPMSSTTVPYGDSDIRLVTTPNGRLGDSLLAHLWWIVWLVGIVVTGVIALLLGHLQASRHRALALARLNEAQHREQRDIAETLQLELLPQDITPPPGLRMATRYWVADTASLIGGDTYDVFQIDERRWAILVGDVCGKGTEAAALTGLVRHTARAAARYSDRPSSVLEAVHAAMAEHRPRTYCTAALMFYEPGAGAGADVGPGGRLTVALGGHPPPLLRTPDGTVRSVGRSGTLLGLIEPVLHDDTVELEPGSTLLAYTDGLTDAAQGRALTVDDLQACLGTSDDVDAIVEEIHRRRASRQAGTSDDTVILVVSVDGPLDAPATDAVMATNVSA